MRLPKNLKVRIWPRFKVTGQRSHLTLKGQNYHFCPRTTKSVRQMCTVPEFKPDMVAKWCSSCCNTTACAQMLTCDLGWPWRGHESKLVIFWSGRAWDMTFLKFIAQSGHFGRTSYGFSIVFQWRDHDLISDLRSLNKKILDMHIVLVHGLTPHAMVPARAKVWPASLQLTLSGDLTWPDLELNIWLEV